MESQDYCCYCGKETGFNEGYEIWESFDGKWGHKWCVIYYDEENKPPKLKLEEKIEKLEGHIRYLDYEKQKTKEEINKIKEQISELEVIG